MSGLAWESLGRESLGWKSIVQGLHNVSANWQVIPLSWLQNLVVTVLTLISLLPFPWALGLMGETATPLSLRDPAAVDAWLTSLLLGLEDRVAEIVFAVALALLLGILVVAVWGWFQGAILGVLDAGLTQAERRPAEGKAAAASPSDHYRVFSGALTRKAGRRWTWPLFWIFHLFVTLSLVLALGLSLLVNLAVLSYVSWGVVIAVGVTLVGGLVLALSGVFLAAWFGLAQATLIVEGQSVRRSTGRSWSLLRKTPWAPILVTAVAFGLGIVSTSISLAISGLIASLFGSGVAGTIANIGWSIVQGLPLAAISVLASAAFLALVRSMIKDEPAMRPAG